MLCQTFVVLDRVFEYGSSERSAKALAVAARVGDLDAVTYLAERNIGDLQHATMQAIGRGHLNIVKYLIEATRVVSNQPLSQVNWLTEAARTGHLDIFIYLHEKLPGLVCRPIAMDHAASMGYFDVVEYIHTHRTEGCTTKAMDGAAMGNHIEIVRFLHANRTDGCSSRAFEKSAERGRTEMVKLLLEISPGNCNVDKCIQVARKRGFAETVEVLENFKALGPRTPFRE
jgi:ankyrin repeat protein